uniref:Uncharacterized protein n=1 Tax=Anopheles atroparvus TaxID=41427 RepID=A0A182ILT7_ANOAO
MPRSPLSTWSYPASGPPSGASGSSSSYSSSCWRVCCFSVTSVPSGRARCRMSVSSLSTTLRELIDCWTSCGPDGVSSVRAFSDSSSSRMSSTPLLIALRLPFFGTCRFFGHGIAHRRHERAQLLDGFAYLGLQAPVNCVESQTVHSEDALFNRAETLPCKWASLVEAIRGNDTNGNGSPGAILSLSRAGHNGLYASTADGFWLAGWLLAAIEPTLHTGPGTRQALVRLHGTPRDKAHRGCTVCGLHAPLSARSAPAQPQPASGRLLDGFRSSRSPPLAASRARSRNAHESHRGLTEIFPRIVRVLTSSVKSPKCFCSVTSVRSLVSSRDTTTSSLMLRSSPSARATAMPIVFGAVLLRLAPGSGWPATAPGGCCASAPVAAPASSMPDSPSAAGSPRVRCCGREEKQRTGSFDIDASHRAARTSVCTVSCLSVSSVVLVDTIGPESSTTFPSSNSSCRLTRVSIWRVVVSSVLRFFTISSTRREQEEKNQSK